MIHSIVSLMEVFTWNYLQVSCITQNCLANSRNNLTTTFLPTKCIGGRLYIVYERYLTARLQSRSNIQDFKRLMVGRGKSIDE